MVNPLGGRVLAEFGKGITISIFRIIGLDAVTSPGFLLGRFVAVGK
jgi:hypothetical protein